MTDAVVILGVALAIVYGLFGMRGVIGLFACYGVVAMAITLWILKSADDCREYLED